MSAASAARRGRIAARRLMTLTLTPYAPAGVTLDGDGYEVQAYEAQSPHAGKVQGGSSSVEDTATRSVTIGGIARPVLSGGLHIPIDAPVPLAGQQRGVGWEYEITAVGAGDDPALLGRRFLVVGVPIKSFATARRLDVVEVS